MTTAVLSKSIPQAISYQLQLKKWELIETQNKSMMDAMANELRDLKSKMNPQASIPQSQTDDLLAKLCDSKLSMKTSPSQ